MAEDAKPSPFVTLYHQETGEKHVAYAVDVRDILPYGEWGLEPPSKRAQSKRGPGRPSIAEQMARAKEETGSEGSEAQESEQP